MTKISYYISVDDDVKKIYRIYNAGERQIELYVMAYLNSPDGWSQDGYFFEQIHDKHKARVLIRLSTTETINKVCGFSESLSCAELHGKHMYLNSERWFHGAPNSKLDLENYRQYMVSHEMGHILGKEHVKCPGLGKKAPIMLQQTRGIEKCIPNTNVKG